VHENRLRCASIGEAGVRPRGLHFWSTICRGNYRPQGLTPIAPIAVTTPDLPATDGTFEIWPISRKCSQIGLGRPSSSSAGIPRCFRDG